MERRLGRGLASLLSEPEPQAATAEIELRLIRPNPFQPRKTFDPAALEELRNSIENHGVLQPVVLRSAAGSGFELISGERRWRAARLAGLAAIPAVIREHVSDEQMIELALVENVQRRDLNPIERALGFRSLMAVLSLTQDGVASRVGLQRSSVANHLRLLDLPEAAREAVNRNLITMGHAKALLGLPSGKRQVELLEEVIRRDLSVRDLEKLVRIELEPRRAKTSLPVSRPRAPWTLDMERRLRESLGTKVTLSSSASYRGQVVIDFFNRQELERIITQIAPQSMV